VRDPLFTETLQISIVVPDLDAAVRGVTFSYHSTDRDLGVIAELFDRPPGVEHVPDATYPPRA
jgi:hypothetical protein